MVKALELEASRLQLIGSSDPFGELVPFSVRKNDSIYSERKAELIRETVKVVEEQANVAKGLLNSLGLPGALEAFETPTGIPPALQHNMATVRQEGGVKMLMEQIELLDKVATQDEILLKEAQEILDAEEQEDAQMRSQYGTRWNRYKKIVTKIPCKSLSFRSFLSVYFSFRTPSHTLTANLRQEAQKSVGHVNHARKSDEFVKQKLRSHAEPITKLTWPAVRTLPRTPYFDPNALLIIRIR